jgi:hypothetical protein
MNASTVVVALAPASPSASPFKGSWRSLTQFSISLRRTELSTSLPVLVALAAGMSLSLWAGSHVLEPLGLKDQPLVDAVVTGLIVSGGTEGFNAIMKFLGYAKEAQAKSAPGCERDRRIAVSRPQIPRPTTPC